MLEIRFHGRGGQGTVVASVILAKAFFNAGYYVQTFPLFGVERRGAPVEAYLRLSRNRIRIRTHVYTPDHVIVQDSRLLSLVQVTGGLKPGGWILINTKGAPEDLSPFGGFRLAWVDATRIAVQNGLGTPTHPMINTAMIGAFARILDMPPLAAVDRAIAGEIAARPEVNVTAARQAYESVRLARQPIGPFAGLPGRERTWEREQGKESGKRIEKHYPIAKLKPCRKSTPEEVSLHISWSHATTTANKTGSWRFLRPHYQEKTAPCSAACPAGEDIGRIEMMAGRRLFSAAGQTALMENPFPAVCGRVCFHPCEAACNRAKLDQPVAIHHLERQIGDYLLEGGIDRIVARRPETGKRIAVIGAGPAGLSAAYFLNRLGYDCEVFEADEAPGGILRWGIPAYRLPTRVLEREIERIEALGVVIRCGVRLPAEFLGSLGDRYHGAFIGCGHGRSVAVKIAGEQHAIDGLDLLRRVRQGRPPAIGGRVAVIGGGNTAIDVARTLVRLGAEPVVCYRRRRQDMPAFGNEVDMALAEGVRLRELTAPICMQRDGTETVSGNSPWKLTLQGMKPVGKGPDGRARVSPEIGMEESLLFQEVVVAVGADAEPGWAAVSGGQKGGLVLSHCVLSFHPIPAAYGGDLTNRVKSVADAVASGKQAAIALDTHYRHGRDAIVEKLAACRVGEGPALSMEAYLQGLRCRRSPHVVSFDEINIDYFEPLARAHPVPAPPEVRSGSFEAQEAEPDPESVAREAARCFNCGLCNACDNCRVFCPEVAVSVKGAERWIELDYCKGCGICVAECPRRAMVMEEEAS